nr:putative capsid [Marmot picobirnavirus]
MAYRNSHSSSSRRSRPSTSNGRRSSGDSRPASNNSRTLGIPQLSQQLQKDFGNLGFSYAVGSIANIHSGVQAYVEEFGLNVSEITVPGALVLGLMPSFGLSEDANSPLNQAVSVMFDNIRSKISGSRPYDPIDTMLYAAALSSCFDWLYFLKFVYKLATTHSNENLYFPDQILRAIGIDVDDIRQHLSDFRGNINVLIADVATFNLPTEFPYFVRNRERFSNIYTEGTTLKDQLYMFYPAVVLLFTHDKDNAGALAAASVLGQWGTYNSNNLAKAEDLLKIGRDMIGEIRKEQNDFAIISSDIRTAFGSAVATVELLSEDIASVVPVFDVAALEQFKNATVLHGTAFANRHLPDSDPDFGLAVIQDPTKSFLYSSVYTAYNAMLDPEISETIPHWEQVARARLLRAFSDDKILTTSSGAVDPGLVLSNTALMATAYDPSFQINTSPGVVNSFIKLTTGTDVVRSATIVYTQWDKTAKRFLPSLRAFNYADVLALDPDTILGEVNEQLLLSNFKYHPAERVFVVKQGSNETSWTMGTRPTYNYDVDNYTVVSYDELHNMQRAMLLASLNVPI